MEMAHTINLAKLKVRQIIGLARVTDIFRRQMEMQLFHKKYFKVHRKGPENL